MENKFKTAVLQVLGNPELADIIGRYGACPAPQVQEQITDFARRLNAKRFIVPIAGIQGTGKSTLLNALAFATPILPIDAVETTCVPVEVVFSAKPLAEAIVHFSDGSTTRTTACEKDLREFVHNDDNPGNKKKVTKIVIESAEPLLRDGLVLVDLPGVLSLTTENTETTKQYLKEAVGVLFLIRTVPPLTRSEALFVGNVWNRIPAAFFVQNRWTDETDSEATDGCEHNVEVLRDVAKQYRIALSSGDPEVLVVNVYDALRGRLADDRETWKKSGVDQLEISLKETAKLWPSIILREVASRLVSALMFAEEKIADKLEDTAAESEAVKAKQESGRVRFVRYIEDLDKKKTEVNRELDEFLNEWRTKIDKWGERAASSIRNAMRTKMRAGIVDGQRLADALRDEQSEPLDDLFQSVQEAVLSMQDRLATRLGPLNAWVDSNPDTRTTVNIEKRRKWESLLAPASSAAGGLAAGLVGLKAGAALGVAIGAPSGPGAIITGAGGAVAGFLGGLLAFWLGKKAKGLVTKIWAKVAESEVFSAIDKFVEATQIEMKNRLENFAVDVRDTLDTWRRNQQAVYESERDARSEALKSTADEKAARREALEKDRKQAEAWLNELQAHLPHEAREET